MDTAEKMFRIFRGQPSVFAIRKGSKTGNPWFLPYRKDKQDVPVTPEYLRKHLEGGWMMGIYPLLKDNTCNLIVVDFDNHKGDFDRIEDDHRRFYSSALEEFSSDGAVMIERSKGGKGYHVWTFLKRNAPAGDVRARTRACLGRAGVDYTIELFPKQDEHIGSGYGNLIALPYHGKSVLEGNTVFLDPLTYEPLDPDAAFDYILGRLGQEGNLDAM